MEIKKLNAREKILLVLLVLVFVALLFWLNTQVGMNLDHHDNDFMLVHIGGNALRAGLDLYDPAEWAIAHERFGNEFYSDNPVFLYPLPIVFFFVPFSFFSIPVGEVIWLFVGEALFIFSVALLFRAIDLSNVRRTALLIFSIALFLPGIATFWARQPTFLLFSFLVSSFLLVKGKKDLPAGLILSFLVLRPNPVVFLIPAIAVWAGGTRRWRLLASATVSWLALLAGSWALRPGWVVAWWDYAIGDEGKIHSYIAYVPTLWGMLVDFSFPSSEIGRLALGVAISIAILAVSAWWLRKYKHGSIAALMIVFVPASLFLSPYAWNYDQLFLLLPLLLILTLGEKFSPVRRHQIWALVLATTLLLPYALRIFALDRDRDTLSALLPFAAWLLGLWTLKLTAKISKTT